MGSRARCWEASRRSCRWRIWLATGSDFWRALAYIGFFLNLLNLLPVLPLDGGRAMAALSPWIWLVGFAGLVALAFFFPNPILFLVLLFGGMESWRRWKLRNTPEGRAYHAIPARTRALVAATYLGPGGAARGGGRGDVPVAGNPELDGYRDIGHPFGVKRLFLLRHAKSSWDDPGLDDHDRPLAPRGRRASELIAEHLRRERIEPSLVLCSSARRTRETLERVMPALGRGRGRGSSASCTERRPRISFNGCARCRTRWSR